MGEMFLYGDLLVTIAGAPETVRGGYVVPFTEVVAGRLPVGGDVPEAEWSSLVSVREPLAGAIRRAVSGGGS